jgi:hypothetical protein
MIAMLLALAFAQSPPEDWTELAPQDPPVTATSDEIAFEMLIVGEHVVAARRAKVIRKMEELGYKARERRDGTVSFTPPETWMGRGRLWKTGELTFTMPAVSFDEAGPPAAQAPAVDTNMPPPIAGQATFNLPSPTAQRNLQANVRAEVAPLLEGYREALRLRGFGVYLETLPDRMSALWETGIGLDQSPLATHHDRKIALLDFWATRTDTPEGRATSRTVEAFLRNVVQESEHPITPAEAAEAQSRRQDGRPLELTRAPESAPSP